MRAAQTGRRASGGHARDAKGAAVYWRRLLVQLPRLAQGAYRLARASRVTWGPSGARQQVPSGPGGRAGLGLGAPLAPGLGHADGGCGGLDAL